MNHYVSLTYASWVLASLFVSHLWKATFLFIFYSVCPFLMRSELVDLSHACYCVLLPSQATLCTSPGL